MESKKIIDDLRNEIMNLWCESNKWFKEMSVRHEKIMNHLEELNKKDAPTFVPKSVEELMVEYSDIDG